MMKRVAGADADAVRGRFAAAMIVSSTRRSIVDGDDDDAAQQAGPECRDPFRTVFAPENDRIARAQPEIVEPYSKVLRAPRGFFVRKRSAPEAIVVDQKLAASA